MKNKLLIIIIVSTLLSIPSINFGQAPNLGTAADFVLFTTVGAVSNTGLSQLTGNVGTNGGSSTAFGNVNGGMHDNDGVSAQCASDLLLAYNDLNAAVPTFFPAPLLGNGQILNAGVYSISGASTLNLDLTLDGQGDPNAVFIFQISGPLSTNANSKVKLVNGALACNVFWKVEGLVDMATGTFMRGTVIANNAAINMNTGDTLEGRVLSTAGAVTVDGVFAYTPIGCGSPYLTGPLAPALASTECYAVFSSDGPVTNNGITYLTGDVGTNVGLTTGFDPLNVTGAIHPIPDGSTAACASDLLNVYNYLNLLPYDIELMAPVQFGNNLTLTPHTYVINGGVTFTDTLYLNAQGNANAVFVIHIFGALSTSTYSRVILTNGTQSQNVYWAIDGAVSINDYSVFRGTIVCNNGAIDLTTGVTIDGRALTTTGAINTTAITVTMPPGCGINAPNITTEPSNQSTCAGNSVSYIVIATGVGLTYQWKKGAFNLIDGGNISGATSPTLTINPANVSDAAPDYYVVIIGSAGPNDTSSNVSLTINPDPIVNLGADVVQPNPPALLDAGAGFTSYLWGTSDSTQTFSAIANGTYLVSVTNSFGCTDSDTIQVNFTSGIINNDGSVTIMTLYPNPSNGPVNFSIENLVTENLVIDVMDMTGRVVYNKYIGSVKGNLIETFDFTSLTMGTYIIRMTANGKSIQMRLIISK